MKKWTACILTALLMISIMTACGCEHEWTDADCDSPATCTKCGATEGAPVGHSWLVATCETAKTCEVCAATEGEALGHDWADADCEHPKTCGHCALTEGEALGHTWVDATTDAPKTCTTCAATEGDKINVDSRFTTSACQHLFGSWSAEMVIDGEKELGLEIPGESLDYTAYLTYTFQNDGTLIIEATFEEESYFHAVELFTIELMYATFEEQGLSRDEADAAMIDTYGMNTADYVKATVAEMDVDDYAQRVEMVYYVSDGKIYAAEDWDDEMVADAYTLEGDKLTMTDNSTGDLLEMTKQP